MQNIITPGEAILRKQKETKIWTCNLRVQCVTFKGILKEFKRYAENIKKKKSSEVVLKDCRLSQKLQGFVHHLLPSLTFYPIIFWQ